MSARPLASYLHLAETGELAERAAQAQQCLAECRLCPHECRVNRLNGELGGCRTGTEPVVSSFGPHFGEEAPLVGRCGSGTIFLTNCNLRCVFCQNADISHLGEGAVVTREQLAQMMVSLQERGCHNINFVTPTHQVPQILSALLLAIEQGFSIPLVYNCGGYESVETLQLLGGVFDIYMPDCKYSDDAVAERLSGARGYWQHNQAALREMHQQVGDLVNDADGIAVKGLLVRHLVLPNGLAGTERVMQFLAGLSTNTYVNVMAQYRPCFNAHQHPELARRPSDQEYEEAVRLAREAGLRRGDRG